MKNYLIVGYAYEAAVHCVSCARLRHQNQPFRIPALAPLSVDSNGLPEDGEDMEGNQIDPVFADEIGDDDCCDDCGAYLDGRIF